MEVIRDFDIKINKSNIFRIINSYYTIPEYSEVFSDFGNIANMARDIIRPVAYFKLDRLLDEVPAEMLKKCGNIVYSIVTVGEKITDITDGLFSENQFEKGLLLDAISTYVLFDISNQLNERIYQFTSGLKLGLTCRIAPGDGELDIDYQSHILEKFKGYPGIEFSITDNYLIKPYKSLSYIFGADMNIELNKMDHKCDSCHNLSCIMRNSYGKIRGPYKI